MTKFFGLLTILMLCAGAVAPACPKLPTSPSIPLFASLPLGSPMYYCAASPVPEKIGDLTYVEWAKHVQVCTSNCTYEAIAPGDPHSPLIATECGAGMHAATYAVEPPSEAPGGKALKLTNPSCNDVAPEKGGPPPSPAPAKRRR